MNYRGAPSPNQQSPNLLSHQHQPNAIITSRSQMNSSSRPRSHNAMNSSLEDFRGMGLSGGGLLNQSQKFTAPPTSVQ